MKILFFVLILISSSVHAFGVSAAHSSAPHVTAPHITSAPHPVTAPVFPIVMPHTASKSTSPSSDTASPTGDVSNDTPKCSIGKIVVITIVLLFIMFLILR